MKLISRLIFIDWNGTQLNDTPLVLAAKRDIFLRNGKKDPTPEEWFSELDRDALHVYNNRGIDATREELDAIYKPYYEARIGSVELYPDVRETLEALSANIGLALLTQQHESLVDPFLIRHKLHGVFRYREFRCAHKDAAMKRICDIEGIHPGEACLVGDAPADMRRAHGAGVVAIRFKDTYIPDNLFVQDARGNAKPDFTVGSFMELRELLEYSP